MNAQWKAIQWKTVIEIDKLKPLQLQTSQTEATWTELSEFKTSFFFIEQNQGGTTNTWLC